MTSLARSLFRRGSRADPVVPFQSWADYMLNYQGLSYAPQPHFTLGGQKQEEIAQQFMGYVHGAYKANGIVFGITVARALLLSEARFSWRRFENSRPTDFFGTDGLRLIERPYGPGSTTRDLLWDMSQDGDLAGNFYGRVNMADGQIDRLRPDWTTIIMGSERDEKNAGDMADARVVGYLYEPGGRGSGLTPQLFDVSEVIHWIPFGRDPAARFRGMSWLQPVVQEIQADKAAMVHKQMFFEQGATANLVVTLPVEDPVAFNEFVEAFEEAHEGTLNAYRTLYFGGGAGATVVGADMQQIDFKVTQSHGEARLAAAARIPAILVGIVAGLEAATYSNYGMARRAFADMTLRPMWGSMASALSQVVPRPPGPDNSELWYDVRDVSFLQEDSSDDAKIQQEHAATINTLIMAGFEPDAVVDAVTAHDLERLEGHHTGMVSVQMHKPGEQKALPPGANGSGPPEAVPAPAENP